MYTKSLFWFRRDLRTYDNAALKRALEESNCVYCVFVFDTNILDKLIDKDDKRVHFIWKALEELKQSLRQKGGDLIILHGDPLEIIARLADLLEVDCVFTNRDYEEYALMRDDMVQAKLNEKKKHFATEKDHVIFESTEVTKPDGSPYTVFTPFKKAWLKVLDGNQASFLREHSSEELFKRNKLANTDELMQVKILLSNKNFKQVNSLKDIGFQEAQLAVETGMSGAQRMFQDFLQNKITKYKNDRNLPAVDGVSNLGIHFRFGTISIRECFREAFKLLDSLPSAEARENIECWISELIWREFYSIILQAFPHVEKEPFKPEYKYLLWRTDERLLQLWKDGLTGYPIVDAAMRQLKNTGQMHNRARMIAASFLTKDLLIDWQQGEEHFARYLLDFELASNNGGWQWSSSTGTDAAPYFRIFNPMLQGAKFDPQAEYIKKFVPELRGVSAEDIHALTFSVQGYPKPIVKHHEVKEAVLELFKTAKLRSGR